MALARTDVRGSRDSEALDDAARKVARQLERNEIETRTLIFLRQDIYELLVEATSDRGKEARVSLDWSHPDLLRELLRRRFVFSGAPLTSSFDDVWREVCVSHVVGEESAQYLIDRCLMRPRFLIDLVNYCPGSAVNLGYFPANRGERYREGSWRVLR